MYIKLGDVVHMSASLRGAVSLEISLSYHFRRIITSICRMCLKTAVPVVSD